MKSNYFKFLLILVLFLSSFVKTNAQIKIESDSAKYFLNKNVIIRGEVAEIYITKGPKPNIILNIDKPYPNQTFSVVIFNSMIQKFDYDIATELKGKTIEVQGKLTSYKNKPQIIVKKTKDIEVLKEKIAE
jgi:DNA/RNA endonuclease YhcR with UshA esterase domain